MKTTYHTKFINGIPIGIPNNIMQGDGFYISYNNYDIGIYGDVTTALVIDGQSNHFYILNGNHRNEYDKRISNGLENCLQYFKDNKHLINKYSESL